MPLPCRSAILLTLLLPAACGPAPIPSGINDPFEQQNRAVHRENLSLDTALVKPLSGAYGGGVPGPFRRSIGNVAGNLDTPRRVVNDVLQFRLGEAVHNTARFAVNTTVGLAGLFDPATAIGLDERDTDFGETLHLWGVREGAYVELPILGPSTDRDTLGKVVDLALNPLSYVLKPPASVVATAAPVLSKLGERFTFKDTVDSVLYDSADGYAQARLLYLEKRRHELRRFDKGAAADNAYTDPYASDPGYIDPYEAAQ